LDFVKELPTMSDKNNRKSPLTFTAIILLGFAPGLFWLWYFYKKDKLEPEPKSYIIKTFCLGMLAAIISAVFEMPFGEYTILSVVLVAPAVEEFVKFSVVRVTMYNNVEFDEPMDGIMYAASAALGFASLENSLYLLGNFGLPLSDLVTPLPDHQPIGFFSLFVTRAFLSVPGHVLFSSMWGYALGWAKFMDKGARFRFILQGYILAVAMHGCFNFLAISSTYGALFLVVFIIIMWKLVGKRIHLALAGSPHIKKEGYEPLNEMVQNRNEE